MAEITLSKRAQILKPSPTLALGAKAKALADKGHDVISLSLGEPDWDTLQVAKDAGIEAIQKGFTKYTPSAGLPELRAQIAEQTQQETGGTYETSQVPVSTGGKFILYAWLQCLCEAGDEVVIPAPYGVSYPVIAELAGATSV